MKTGERVVWIWLWLLAVAMPLPGWGSIEPVEGRNGMVVAGHPEAAEIGLEILRGGGNAMDAVVATSLALGVAEPYGSGLGGKGAILYREAKTGTVWFIDGMDAAGAAFEAGELEAMSPSRRAVGGHAVGVPGLLAALDLGHRRWGRQAWAELVRPSVDLAREGSLVVPGMRVFLERRRERIESHPETARIYLPGGDLPETGDRLPNPDLADTLERIAEAGRDGFYRGEVAEKLVRGIRDAGGRLTLEDFRDYRARIGETLRSAFGDRSLVTAGPPTTGGATAFLGLKVLENHGWDLEAGLRAPENLDRWGQVLRQVYPRIQATVADTAGAVAGWRALGQPDSLTAFRKAAGLERESPIPVPEVPAMPAASGQGDAWTTHFVVIDQEGNVASVTQSLSHHFGSGITAPGTGVVLNNSLKNFSFSDPGGVNYGYPGKRPRSTIAPVIGLEGGEPFLAFGLPGGGRIPTTTLAVLLDVLVFERPLGEAIAAPRFHLRRSWSRHPDSDHFQLEAGFPEAVAEALRGLNWKVETVKDTEFFGGITAIEILPDGRYRGWADERRTNEAEGF
jgi:gamma-glutamyltranspeptidase/glutathione hydrolase